MESEKEEIHQYVEECDLPDLRKKVFELNEKGFRIVSIGITHFFCYLIIE